MILNSLSSTILISIEEELKQQVSRLNEHPTLPFYEMLTYHMGWTGEKSGPEGRGKRIRPLMLLLISAACGSEWHSSLPASAAVELIHNFSLIHDDIQDNSEKRHGRMTVWKNWGIPLGINAGDAFFVLSNQAILDLHPTYAPEIVLRTANIIHQTCLHLTQGQFLDMWYENRTGLKTQDYWIMIQGKTAALFKASCEIGALLGGANETIITAYSDFGHYIGLAFQVQDDFLGIWGDAEKTGKSTISDLVTGKKTLPVLFGLEKKGKFSHRWEKGGIKPDEIPALSEILAEEGALLYTQDVIDRLVEMAFKMLRLADPAGEAGEDLFGLLQRLIQRAA